MDMPPQVLPPCDHATPAEPVCRPCCETRQLARLAATCDGWCACLCGCTRPVGGDWRHTRCATCNTRPTSACWRPRGDWRRGRPVIRKDDTPDYPANVIDDIFERVRYCRRTHQPIPVVVTTR